MSPKISIIIPIFNVENYLLDCINSILDQSYDNYEMICIDDGSTDNSGKIIDEIERKDERIKVIHKENGGQSSARNVGLRAALGKHIMFLDSDDMLVDGALGILDEAIGKYDVDIIGYETAPLIYDEGMTVDPQKNKYYSVDGNYMGIKSGKEYFTEMIEGKDFVESAGLFMFKKTWLDKNDMWFAEGRIYEDADFIFRSHMLCKKMIHIPEKLYIYRVRKGSTMTQAFSLKQAECRLWVTEVLLKEVFSKEHTQREINAIVEFALGIIYHFKFISNHLGYEDLQELHKKEGVDKFFVRTCEIETGKGIYNRELYFRGLLDVAKTYENVILYGAGIVGTKTYETLKKYNAIGNITGFAITKCEVSCSKCGIPVRQIDDYSPSENTAVIITAGGKFHMEMIDIARTIGFEHFYLVDYKLESYMDGLLSGESNE